MLKKAIKNIMPQALLHKMQTAFYSFSVLTTLNGYGSEQTKIKCVICGLKGRFTAFGSPPRYQAKCPNCGALERHRLLVIFDKREEFFLGKSVLHFAPESIIQKIIKTKAEKYLAADINPGHADIQLNIEAIDQPSEVWDVIVASHVLEHVNDDLALKEIYRVLKKGGRFIAMVPIIEGWYTTYEDSSITKPEERTRHFGQFDHVRYYGRDFNERLIANGFTVRELFATGKECAEYALLRGEKVFCCDKT